MRASQIRCLEVFQGNREVAVSQDFPVYLFLEVSLFLHVWEECMYNLHRDMDLGLQYFIFITSVCEGIQLGFWCFPTCILSNSFLNIELGLCLSFGWIRSLPGEEYKSQLGGELPWHVDVCFLRLRFRSLQRGFSASHSSTWPTKSFDTF